MTTYRVVAEISRTDRRTLKTGLSREAALALKEKLNWSWQYALLLVKVEEEN